MCVQWCEQVVVVLKLLMHVPLPFSLPLPLLLPLPVPNTLPLPMPVLPLTCVVLEMILLRRCAHFFAPWHGCFRLGMCISAISVRDAALW